MATHRRMAGHLASVCVYVCDNRNGWIVLIWIVFVYFICFVNRLDLDQSISIIHINHFIHYNVLIHNIIQIRNFAPLIMVILVQIYTKRKRKKKQYIIKATLICIHKLYSIHIHIEMPAYVHLYSIQLLWWWSFWIGGLGGGRGGYSILYKF